MSGWISVDGRWRDVSVSDARPDDVDPTIATQWLPRRDTSSMRTLSVAGGTLVGRSAGEWGGDLYFLDDDHHATKLDVDDNVVALRKLDDVFTGIAHLGSSHGAVFRVARDAGGWRAVPLVQLPAAPNQIRQLPNRAAFVVLTDDGAVVVDVAGTIEKVPCRLARP